MAEILYCNADVLGIQVLLGRLSIFRYWLRLLFIIMPHEYLSCLTTQEDEC